MILRSMVVISVFVLSAMSLGVGAQARCTYMSDVLMCDDGVIEVERSDGIYTLVGDDLFFEQYDYPCFGYPDYVVDYDYGCGNFSAGNYQGPYCLYGDCGYGEIKPEQQTRIRNVKNQSE